MSGSPLELPYFGSILFDQGSGHSEPTEPACFADLNLDQLVRSVVGAADEYQLTGFFYQPLQDEDLVRYRQDVLADVQTKMVRSCLDDFASRMRLVASNIADGNKLRERYQRERFAADAVQVYCQAVEQVAEDLGSANLSSVGLQAFREYVRAYTDSNEFKTIKSETGSILESLAAIRYTVHSSGFRVTVRKYDGEADYSDEVQKTFARFEQGAVADHLVQFSDGVSMNHVEASILELVARLYPDVFAALDEHFASHASTFDPRVMQFEQEVQFYLHYLSFAERLGTRGLSLCRPEILPVDKQVAAKDTYDLPLAAKLIDQRMPIVTNDFELNGSERIFVVSGPNQGGKTTFARTFGQIHYLASLGLLVPGTEAKLFLFDQLFTHFEKEEDLADFSGKLEDDLVRAHKIFDIATSSSIIIMNEIFTSTTLEDATFLGEKVLSKVTDLGCLCVYVTFVDELASLNGATVSMVSTVATDDPTERTYKVARKPADGLSYAVAIAEKYQLTYELLKGRIRT